MTRLFFAVLLSVALATAAQATQIDLQGVRIEIPVPKGFGDPSRTMPMAKTLAETMTPPTNRLQLVLMSEADLNLVRKGGAARWDRYLMVQTNRKLEEVNVSDSEFEKINSGLGQRQATLLAENKEAVDKLMKGASTKFSHALGGPAMSLAVGQTVPLGVFASSRKAIAVGSLITFSAESGGQTYKQPMVTAMVLAHIRNKVVFLYAYATYRTQADIDEVKRTTATWIAGVEAANR
jgi:hypothetical protein